MPRPHPPEFRAEAIRLARSGERPIRATALGLGISESCLRRWLDQDDMDGGRKDGLTTGERKVSFAQGESGAAPGAGDLEKSRGLLHPGERDAVTAFRFIEVEKASYPISMLCRLVGVSASGYHAWRRRPESPRRRSDNALSAWIAQLHRTSRGTYGAPRVHAELCADGTRVGKKRVARLMRELGIEGAYRRKYRRITTADEHAAAAPDLVRRDFRATRPDQLWVADIAYVRTWQGWLYVAVVVDTYSRRVVGWSMRDDLQAELVVDALEMAVWRRRSPRPGLCTTQTAGQSIHQLGDRS